VNQRETIKAELDQAHAEKAELQKLVDALESERDTLANEVTIGEVKEEALVEEANRIAAVSPPEPLSPLVIPPAPSVVEERAPEKLKKKPEIKDQKEVSEKVSGKPSVSPPQAAPVDQRPNQVLSVNRKFNFVVVNMGLRNRLKMGDTLRVEQNGKLIGRIQVEKLYENFAACTILEEIKPAQIQEGDLVRIA
jgi:hypothetical protein